MAKGIEELSIDSRTLYEKLIEVPEGETITYPDLSQTINRDVQSVAYGNLHTARRMAQKDNQITFGTVRGVGLKRLSQEETVSTSEHFIKRIRRTARNGIRQVSSISDFDAMPNEARVKHNTAMSVLGAMYAFTKPGSIKRIENRVQQVQKELPIGKTLEAFSGG